MKAATKVKKFQECINATRHANSCNPAILMAHAKFKLNAACVEDQDEWFEALAIEGHPFSEATEPTQDGYYSNFQNF